MKYLRTLTIITEADISQQEIPLFRGAVIKSLGEDANLLFHNHIDDNQFRYSYPLIQYKRLGGKAAIVCIGDGIEMISSLLRSSNLNIQIGRRKTSMKIADIGTHLTDVGCCNESRVYKLEQWLPLNSKNYQAYQNTDDLISRIIMLNDILVANILSLFKGLDVYIGEEVEVSIIRILRQNIVKYKGIGLTAFDVEFKANVLLPLNIGIGKNVSVGFGNITESRI